MDKPRTSSMTDEYSCIICEQLGSFSATNSDLDKIIKISGEVTTLRAAPSKRQYGLLSHSQTEFVYAHTSCPQKYINKKYFEIYKNKQNETSSSPPKKKLESSTNLSNFDWEKLFALWAKTDEPKDVNLD
ncbi:hypothetical protein JTB14_024142 [Gonioctena quinquepunctata]|nr:hypothetical protein JTB14_024142 [Gonioctena quinquepunctata]